MNYLRVVILVVLSVLLPLRGAVAATMLCPAGEAMRATQPGAEQGRHDMHADHVMHADNAAAQAHQHPHPHPHPHESADAADEGSTSGDHPANCHVCASTCCMASMVGTVAALGQPGPTHAVTFPALTAPVPAFHSGGQDRPPRTL